MTAAALLHPDVSRQVVDRFRSSGVDIKIQDNLEHAENFSAALIFGGDGTVHRYLAQLHHLKIPTLVVPVGSGNDFAKALGIRSVEIAMRAWEQFCIAEKNSYEKNVRGIDLG